MAHLGRAGRPPSSPLSRVKLPRQPENGAAVHDPERHFPTVNCRAANGSLAPLR